MNCWNKWWWWWSGHGRERIFLKSAWLFKKPETFVSKLLGNTGCSPYQPAELDSIEVRVIRMHGILSLFKNCFKNSNVKSKFIHVAWGQGGLRDANTWRAPGTVATQHIYLIKSELLVWDCKGEASPVVLQWTPPEWLDHSGWNLQDR